MTILHWFTRKAICRLAKHVAWYDEAAKTPELKRDLLATLSVFEREGLVDFIKYRDTEAKWIVKEEKVTKPEPPGGATFVSEWEPMRGSKYGDLEKVMVQMDKAEGVVFGPEMDKVGRISWPGTYTLDITDSIGTSLADITFKLEREFTAEAILLQVKKMYSKRPLRA